MDFQSAMDQVNAYFAQLNDTEKYCWLAAVAGFGMVVVGVVLLFI